MKRSIRQARLDVWCASKEIEESQSWQKWPRPARTKDEVEALECQPSKLDVPGIVARRGPVCTHASAPPLRPRLKFCSLPVRRGREEVGKAVLSLKRKHKVAQLLPAIVSTSAVLSKWWALGREEMFYDHGNMWSLRCAQRHF